MEKRPTLDKNISVEKFKDFYWLKKELVTFCREMKISPSGGKVEIAKRIEHYLNTGEKSIPQKHQTTERARITTSGFDRQNALLSDDTVITHDYKNSQNVRQFFAKAIGKKFTFNILFMKWMKENTGKTLGDATQEWLRIEKMKKDKNYISKIPAQLEYNRYFRDFFKDNPNLKREDAIQCWKKKKSLPGSNAYEPGDLDL